MSKMRIQSVGLLAGLLAMGTAEPREREVKEFRPPDPIPDIPTPTEVQPYSEQVGLNHKPRVGSKGRPNTPGFRIISKLERKVCPFASTPDDRRKNRLFG